MSSAAAVIFLLSKTVHVCNGYDKLVKCTFVNKNVRISPIKFDKIKTVILTNRQVKGAFLKTHDFKDRTAILSNA